MHTVNLAVCPALIAFCTLEVSTATTNTFVNPPPVGSNGSYTSDLVYAVGSTVTLTWRTDYTDILVILWQIGTLARYDIVSIVPAMTSYHWEVNLPAGFDLDESNVFYFQVWDEHHLGTKFFASRTFEITNGTQTLDSISQPTQTARPTSTLPSSNTQQPSQNQSIKRGLSTSTKMGIGIGAGVVISVLLGMWFCIAYLRWEKRLRSQQRSPHFDVDDIDDGDGSAHSR